MMMWLRSLHRMIGVILAPFFIFTALAAGTLVLIKWLDPNNQVVGFELRRLLTDLHNYTYFAEVLGLVLAAAVLFMSVTGLIMGLQVYWRRFRGRRARQSAKRKQA